MTSPTTTTSPSVLAVPEVRPGATNPEIVAWVRTMRAPDRTHIEMPPARQVEETKPVQPLLRLDFALALVGGIVMAAALAWLAGAPL